MAFADLIAGLNLPTVEAFSGLFPAGKFQGSVKQVEVHAAGVNDEGKPLSARLVFIYELTMADGTTRDLYDTCWIPAGTPDTWNKVPVEAGKKSEFEQNHNASRKIRTRLDNFGLAVNGSQDPSNAIGLPVTVTTKHSKGYSNIVNVEIRKQAPARAANIPQFAPQQVAPAAPQFAPQQVAQPVQQAPQAGVPVQQGPPAANPFAGM